MADKLSNLDELFTHYALSEGNITEHPNFELVCNLYAAGLNIGKCLEILYLINPTEQEIEDVINK